MRSAVSEIAQELVVLYQTRVHTSGYAFAEDTPWQKEMEDSYCYVDQKLMLSVSMFKKRFLKFLKMANFKPEDEV